ncbi:hypothetical protein PYW08_001347 [Mythimna loreyi]|uniref:Uncharacterized protein n=1 Tax=Mythimna loreyi TaxID=667449 RepID=A0ACC2R0P6_9NEOP|nr:hypothetical protein PYW08_001347 [Mythimna loreyi]
MLKKLFYKKHAFKKKRGTQSTSVPVLVSDASVADLQHHFKSCPSKKNATFQINTLRFIDPPKDSPPCSPRLSPRSSTDNGSLNNFLPRDAIRICLPKKPTRICIPKESPRICFIKEPPVDVPVTCPRLGRTGSKSSLNNFLPKESPKSCLPRKRCKFCSKPKKTSFKDGCVQSVELVSSDDTDKCECMQELYFNDEAKRSGGSSPRGQTCKERNSDIVKLQPECSLEALKRIIKEKKRRSCEKDPKDSGATSSLAESASATCDASATYYHNKLLATLQILQNKEETIRVQADSLAVAEERIATLTERANELKKELDRKTKEYSALRKTVECCKPQQVDACFVTDRPMEDQTDIVSTLQNNLSVIEDLYRECFYETAKQENLIEMLRSSYLDVRVMDKQKADQIGHLQTVINSQQWSLERCQDIALEVDGLKMEISNFLNSSSSTNNDSGMWERSEESYAPALPGVQDDLQDVREQLLRLQDILAYDSCTCGFNEENMKWKKKAESLEIKVAELRGKLCELECSLATKWDTDAKFKADIESKDQELERIREQLVRTQNSSREQSSTVESMSVQLGQTKALLSEKTTEVTELRKENESQMHTITNLKEELAKADQIIKENCKMRSEVAYLTTQVSLWRSQLDESKRRVHALEADLGRTRAHAQHIDECYREKASKVAELQAHLEAAHARGTALCGEARRAVCGVRVWMRRMRDKHREKDAILKEKEGIIAVLRRSLEERQNDSQLTSASENTASCSKCLSSRDVHSFCSKTGRERQRQFPATSANEMPSCSSTPTSTPMRLRKKPCGNNYLWMCDEEMQAPTRRDAGSDAGHDTFCRHTNTERDVRHVRLTLDRAPRDVSPTEDLLLRVEQLSEALADGSRRWGRPRDKR